MTLLDRLHAHRGGLVRIRSELYWYGGRGWDGVRGRIGLLLDVATDNDGFVRNYAGRTYGATPARTTRVAALLLIDGAPHWVWVATEDIELLDGDHR